MADRRALDRPDSVPFMVSAQGQHEAQEKGYKLLESEYPRDPAGRLNWSGAA